MIEYLTGLPEEARLDSQHQHMSSTEYLGSDFDDEDDENLEGLGRQEIKLSSERTCDVSDLILTP